MSEIYGGCKLCVCLLCQMLRLLFVLEIHFTGCIIIVRTTTFSTSLSAIQVSESTHITFFCLYYYLKVISDYCELKLTGLDCIYGLLF